MEDKEIFWVLERQVRDYTEFAEEESNGYYGTCYLPDAIRFDTKELAERFKPAYGINKTPYTAAQYEVITRKIEQNNQLRGLKWCQGCEHKFYHDYHSCSSKGIQEMDALPDGLFLDEYWEIVRINKSDFAIQCPFFTPLKSDDA